jgi:hypothetical protein
MGVPYAPLWGLLTIILRFLPYVGIWASAIGPVLLSVAVSPGWGQPLLILSYYVAIDLVMSNVIEPLLFSHGTGVSSVALLVAAVFWAWLWGPVGLLLATPLTVCVAVMGRYVPDMGYLNVILGVEPVLTPQARFYQRLLAMDEDEVEDLAEEFANENGLLELYDQVVIPALALAEQDRHAHALEEQRERFIFDTTRELIEYLEDRSEQKDEIEAKPKNVVHRPPSPVCILAAHDEADHVAALALARMLEPPEFNPHLVTTEEIDRKGCGLLCISAVPPHAAAHAGHLCRRLKSRLPELKVVVALWTSESSERLESRLRDAGVDHVVTRLPEAIAKLRELQQLKSGTDPIYVGRHRPARRGKAGEPSGS